MASRLDRRSFLRLAAAGVGAATLAGCGGSSGDGDPAAAAGSEPASAPSGATRKLKLGFIALTDAAPIIMAKELGYYAERGLDVEVIKQAS